MLIAQVSSYFLSCTLVFLKFAQLCGFALCWAIDLEDMDIDKRAPPVYWSTPARRSLVDFGQTPGQESDCARPAAMVALRACRSYCAQNYKKFPGENADVTSFKCLKSNAENRAQWPQWRWWQCKWRKWSRSTSARPCTIVRMIGAWPRMTFKLLHTQTVLSIHISVPLYSQITVHQK